MARRENEILRGERRAQQWALCSAPKPAVQIAGKRPSLAASWRRISISFFVLLSGALGGQTASAATFGEFSLDELPPRHTLVVRFAVEPSALSGTLAEVLPAVFSHALEQGRVPGLVFLRTLHADPDRLFVEAGLEVDAPVEHNGGTALGVIAASELPAQRSATVDFYGPYQELPAAHQQLEAWWSQRGLIAAGPPVEYYVTDPTSEPDPSKWLTRVHHPVLEEGEVATLLSFVTGRWESRGRDPYYEETWTPFIDGEALGTFRMRSEAAPVFYEFQAIDLGGSVSEDGGTNRPTLRIKHFDPGLVGWEEKDESKLFVLSALAEQRAVFTSREGDRLAELIYAREGDALSIVLHKWGGEKASTSRFSFVRAP